MLYAVRTGDRVRSSYCSVSAFLICRSWWSRLYTVCCSNWANLRFSFCCVCSIRTAWTVFCLCCRESAIHFCASVCSWKFTDWSISSLTVCSIWPSDLCVCSLM